MEIVVMKSDMKLAPIFLFIVVRAADQQGLPMVMEDIPRGRDKVGALNNV